VACQVAALLLSQLPASLAPTACAQPASHRVREKDTVSQAPRDERKQHKIEQLCGRLLLPALAASTGCNCPTSWSQVLPGAAAAAAAALPRPLPRMLTPSTVATNEPLSLRGWLMIMGLRLSSMRMESTSSTIANPNTSGSTCVQKGQHTV
jgi:hypothetical protein